MKRNRLYGVRGINAEGEARWYTGKAGETWLGPKTEAFAYTVMEARAKARNFNRMTDLHGWHFIVHRLADEA